MRQEMAEDEYYSRCARNDVLHDHVCQRDPLRPRKPVDWEHALIYANQQVNEYFAIIPICWWAHRGPGMVKEINEWIALSRATPEDFERYPKSDWPQRLRYLQGKYGIYQPTIESKIAYA